MNIKTLSLKNFLETDEGESYIDLSSPVVIMPALPRVKGIYIVDEFTEMRPDLISVKYYGTPSFLDILCKLNLIYNPFSIKKGDILIILDLDNPDQFYQKAKTGSINADILQKAFVNKNLNEKDKNRLDRIKAKARDKKGGVKTPLPPNFMPSDKNSTVVKNGRIILGANLKNSTKI